jgi:predicted amidohydrolase YtcJ
MFRRRQFALMLAALALPLSGCGDDENKEGEGEAEGGEPAAPKDYADPRIAADLIVSGGRIITLDSEMPEVEAIAIKGGTIVEIGKKADLEILRGAKTRDLDLKGGVAVPGLTDAHAHLGGLGDSLATVDLRGAASVEEVVERLKKGAPKDGWIIGRGWDQNLWADKAMPTHQPLTDAFPDRPVWLRRVDGHAGWANAKVLELAGITVDTPDPEGGEFLRNEETTEVTGVLVDTAMDVVKVPDPSPEERRRRLLAAQEHVLERGIVGLHDMGIGREAHALYQALEKEGLLKLRVHAFASRRWFEQELKEETASPLQPNTRYALVGVKVYVDGALGSRGAAMLRPYSDRRGHRGKLISNVRKFESLTLDAVEHGWQIAAHAIGDRGNRTILDAYGRVEQRHRHKDMRMRIEHAQIVDPSDIPRFSKLRVIASMQPTHATSDMPWVPDRVGSHRLEGAYAWRRFLKSGARMPLGSDFPVEKVDITHGIYAAITRQDPAGQPEGGWLPDQRLTLDEAIAGFTREAAYAVRRERSLGRLSKGFRGDLTCFVGDLWKMEAKEVREAEVLATVIDGEVVYRRG